MIKPLCDKMCDEYSVKKPSKKEFKKYVEATVSKFDLQDCVDRYHLDVNDDNGVYHYFTNYLVERFRITWCNTVLVSKDKL